MQAKVLVEESFLVDRFKMLLYQHNHTHSNCTAGGKTKIRYCIICVYFGGGRVEGEYLQIQIYCEESEYCFLGDEFFQDGKGVQRNDFFFLFLSLFDLLSLFYFEPTLLIFRCIEPKKKKLLKRRVGLFLFFWAKMIVGGNIWPKPTYWIRIHLFLISIF